MKKSILIASFIVAILTYLTSCTTHVLPTCQTVTNQEIKSSYGQIMNNDGLKDIDKV
jgi:hypothetical protein